MNLGDRQISVEGFESMETAHPFDVADVVFPVAAKPTAHGNHLEGNLGFGSGVPDEVKILARISWHVALSPCVGIGGWDHGEMRVSMKAKVKARDPLRDGDDDQGARPGRDLGVVEFEGSIVLVVERCWIVPCFVQPVISCFISGRCDTEMVRNVAWSRLNSSLIALRIAVIVPAPWFPIRREFQ